MERICKTLECKNFLTVKHLIAQVNMSLHKSYSYLKPKQYIAIDAALHNDVLAILPTGYGKSIIYQALPFASDYGCVIVISPLNSIIYEQSLVLGDSCVIVNGDKDLAQININTRYIIGHPEIITSDGMKKQLRQDQALQERVSITILLII